MRVRFELGAICSDFDLDVIVSVTSEMIRSEAAGFGCYARVLSSSLDQAPALISTALALLIADSSSLASPRLCM